VSLPRSVDRSDAGGTGDAARAAFDAFGARFRYVYELGRNALGQLGDDDVQLAPASGCSPPAAIVKHLRGNMRSRFTDFLTTDGEKPWRDRDGEFDAAGATAAEVRGWWEEAFALVFATLGALGPEDLGRTVTIRGERHSVALALMRSLDHASYHTGQLVWACKIAVGEASWRTLTIPPGGSAAHNASMGFDAESQSGEGA